MILIGLLVVGAGVALIAVGKAESGGSYLTDGYTYELRTPGIVVLALALLVTPLTLLCVRCARAWARDRQAAFAGEDAPES